MGSCCYSPASSNKNQTQGEPCEIIHSKSSYEWTNEIEMTLKNIACTQYNFPLQLFTLLLSFIDRKFKISDPNSKINYPIYIPPNILTCKLTLPTEPKIDSSHIQSQSLRASRVKVILLGESGVGKTATIYRFTRDEFECDWDLAIEDTFAKVMEIDDNVVMFQIKRPYGYHGSPVHKFDESVLFFMFAMNDKSTFEAIDKYYKPYAQYGDDTCGNDNGQNKNGRKSLACILVGNKSDLHVQDDDIQVSLDEAVDYAQKNNMLFVQTSAKKSYDGGNVELLFEIAARYAAILGKIDFCDIYSHID